jgi:hypothetical protein
MPHVRLLPLRNSARNAFSTSIRLRYNLEMRWRSWWLWSLVLASIITLVASILLCMSSWTTITRENLDGIQKGMTLEEVEGILGPPRLEGNDRDPAIRAKRQNPLYSKNGLVWDTSPLQIARGWDSHRGSAVIIFQRDEQTGRETVQRVIIDQSLSPTVTERLLGR